LVVSEDLIAGLVTDGAAAMAFPVARVATAVDGVAGVGAEAEAVAADGNVALDAGPVANSIVEATGEADVESTAVAGVLFEEIGKAGGGADAGRAGSFAASWFGVAGRAIPASASKRSIFG
jgi:hypothetical protein